MKDDIYNDEYFDRPPVEVPELDMSGSDADCFLLKLSDAEAYVVYIHAVRDTEKINIFAPVVNYNNSVTIPYIVDFVAEELSHVEKFLKEYKVPFTDIAKKVTRL